MARENFDLDALEIEVCEMDALQFLREAGGQRAGLGCEGVLSHVCTV